MNQNIQRLKKYIEDARAGIQSEICPEELDGETRELAEELLSLQEQYESEICRLRAREEQLLAEAGQRKLHLDMLDEYNTMIMQLMLRHDSWILVVDSSQTIFYCNKFSQKWSPYPSCDTCGCRLSIRPLILEYYSEENEQEWDAEDSEGKWCYHIHSYRVMWRGKQVYAHVIADVTEERIRENRLRDMAYRDGVTGIHNLHYFTRVAKGMLKRRECFSFVFMDLDGLKEVNDTYGHQAGDGYISLVSKIVQKSIRSQDVFARIGGDEFGILFYRCPKELADRRLAEIAEQVHSAGNLPYQPGVSYGVVYVGEENIRSLDAIIREADDRMYENKRNKKK